MNTPYILEGSKAIVIEYSSSKLTLDKDTNPISIEPKIKSSGIPAEINFASWGDGNEMPNQIVEKAYKNVTVSSNVDFNVHMLYGDGIKVYKRIKENGKIILDEQLPSEQPEVFEFIENNNLNKAWYETATDLSFFYSSFIQFLFSKENKIVSLEHKETIYSRVSIIDEKEKRSLYHGYSAKWAEGKPDDVVASILLDDRNPNIDLKRRRGLYPYEDGKTSIEKNNFRYIIKLSLPTPGRFFYEKPYWWSIFESGWYDFSSAIPELKKNIFNNQAVLKYQVIINETFWQKLFNSENADNDEKRKQVKKKFLDDLDSFLKDVKNTGKSLISYYKINEMKGIEEHDIIIKAIENPFKSGEYVEDSEDASNNISNVMGVHPSLKGAAPGKAKSINGTEARELFIIKQSLCKPERDLFSYVLNIVKQINGWDPDLVFAIPNIMLTTLDQGTGAVKSIGNQEV